MFLSVRRCTEHMTQLPRLKVTCQGHVIYPSIRVRSISPESFERFSLNFTQMFHSVRWCAEHMTQLPRLKAMVTGQGVYFQGHVIYSSICVHSISPESFERFSLSFTQMFLTVRRCTKHMTQLPRLKVTGQGHVIYPSIHVCFISPEYSEWFSLNFTQMFLSVRRHAIHMAQLP